MTDLEISKALALAIGWPATKIHTHLHGTGYAVSIIQPNMESVLKIFDFRDWNVIGPIAERFDLFPMKAICHADQWAIVTESIEVYADTPQKAIALAVIQGAMK
jgi:hypothetical protein